MNAVVFGKNDYGGQIINDLSPFYALLYPFETIEQTHDWIIVKKKQFPNIHFVQLLQPIFPKEIRKRYDWIYSVNPTDYIGDEKIYFGCFGECYDESIIENVETYDKFIFSSFKDEYKDSHKHYQEPLLHFTRNFHFYGFNFTPPLYEFTTFNNQNEKSISFCYNSGLDGTDGNDGKRGFRKEIISEINTTYPNSIVSPQKSDDFRKTNLKNEDYKNWGWYWDFNRAWTTLIFETYPAGDGVNHFYTEKTFRGLMSGNAFILAVDNDKLRYLQSKGFWILNTDRDLEDIYHMANNNFESFKNLIKDNSSKMINNQRILYDWYYKDNNFKMNTIKWMLGEI